MNFSKRYLLPLAALFLAAACSDDETEPIVDGNDFSIMASIDSAPNISWKSGDRIKVVSGDDLYTFETTGSGATAEFTAIEGDPAALAAGTNPVSAYYECSSIYGAFRIQAEQQVDNGTVQTAIPMYAYTMNAPTQNRLTLTFRPLASVLNLTVDPYDITVTDLAIAPADGATVSGGAICGGFTVDAAHQNVTTTNGLNELALRFNSGLNLSNGALLHIPLGWFAIDGGLKLTFSDGSHSFESTVWAENGVVRTYTESEGFRRACEVAATFTFDTDFFPRDWYVKANTTADKRGTSWDEATTLAHALEAAAAGSTIHIAAGTYRPETLIAEAADDATDASKTFEIGRNLTLIGGYPANPTKGAVSNPSANATIFDGTGCYHTMVLSAPKTEGEHIVLNGLTISGGTSDGTAAGSVTINDITLLDNYAAGIAVLGTRAELIDCTITKNSANNAGGLFTQDADLTMTGCTISENKGTNGAGAWIGVGTQLKMNGTTIAYNVGEGVAAGLYFYTAADEALSAEITDCDIIGNEATANAGGIYVRDESGNHGLSATFTDCRVTANKGNMGGAMVVLNGKPAFKGCSFTANESAGNGLIYINTSGAGAADVLFDGCSVCENVKSALGAGIYIYSNSTGGIKLAVLNSTFAKNVTTGRGGAIYARSAANNVEVTCVNSTFVDNQSGAWGGAFDLYGTAAANVKVSLISCTLTRNYAAHATSIGGGVNLETVGTKLETYNTIISGNIATPDRTPNDINVVKAGDASVSVIHRNTIVGDQFFNASGSESATTPTFTASTMIAELADNGGKTKTCKLIGSVSTNFAFGNGMTATELRALAAGEITADILAKDQTGAARSDSDRIVGACVVK